VAVVGWAGALACLPLILSAGLLALGIWLPPAGAALAALLAGSGQTVYDYARARRARAEIIRSFGQYLAPELVRQLAENPEALRLGGERRVLTVLFCDLRGFTTLSERMKDRPDLLTTWLNEAMEVLARAVVDNGGMVDKFIGDCVMALWNAPADDPDHAPHALAAGRAMVAGIAELSARIGAEGHDVTLACGVGINTGECTVGNMGSSLRFDYTAIGDPVNLASRLEGLTKSFGTPILIGSATARALGNEDLVALGRAPIKGRSEEEEVFTPREMHVRAAPVAART
ncbi:adenylate/guanylate cyclase domain-containing protein, partial [Pseudooceanicola lipolyticus]|uniref:adenylate/guanylate cyclase domain-containing protein n=1 Tax=Pseudooceanicola lipolyticus TaxID=2029104 RepID=UPI00155E6991